MGASRVRDRRVGRKGKEKEENEIESMFTNIPIKV